MAKFAKLKKVLGKGPTNTVGYALTANGGIGFASDDKTALYTLAVTNMVSEVTYYESAANRDDRFAELVRSVVATDPQWVASLAKWLRNVAQMRSASIVVAAEYAAAKGPHPRSVVDSVCQRGDEPAELLGYWLGRHGRAIPMSIKRGLADAVKRLYTQQAAVKWDSANAAIRMADVIDLIHPKPVDEKQSELFCYLLDKRHKRENPRIGNLLAELRETIAFDQIPAEQRREWITNHPLPSLYTWERLSGWLPGGMDAQAWEMVIPNMGYMALLRNIRNFEQAGVRQEVLTEVAKTIENPEKVIRSRQFPYRFWSAYKSSGTMKFGPSIEVAMQVSVPNIPKLPGRTLIAVDTSGSMQSPVSGRSQVLCVEAAAVFASAIAANSDVDVMIYANYGKTIKRLPTSVLRSVEAINGMVGSVGHGTNTWPSVMSQYKKHDRIIVFTDMQDNPALQPQLPNVPVYVWDLRGYGVSNVRPASGRYLFAGFNDASFGLIDLLEKGLNSGWPWEN